MTIEFEDKIKLIRNFQSALSRIHEAALRIRMAGKQDKYEEIIEQSYKLSDLIDDLIGEAMREWSEESEDITNKLKNAIDSIKESIETIKKEIEIANNLVKFLGELDKIIKTATEIIGAIL